MGTTQARHMLLRSAMRTVALGALATGGTALAQAADQASTDAASAAADVAPADDIVVTGIRGSLTRSIDIKRNADVIVDSIAAEDIGKFPDTNVAESLQRITGVSIDRSNGEGQFVTVRGFGPTFNTVLVNGRTIATENPGRAFSFDLLAAELISGADVYKTNNAALQEGGIGATINIKTARPFNIRGSQVVLSAQGNYEQLAEELTPEAFGLVSTRLADDRIGLLFSVSYQNRKARTERAATNGYFRPDPTQLPASLGFGTTPIYFPQNYDQIVDEQDRERIGLNGVAQFRATDNLVLTVDGLWNKFTVDSSARSIGHFFSPGEVTSGQLDGNRTLTSFTQSANGHTDYITRTFNRPTKVRAAGFNADWDVTDRVNVKFDIGWSKATSNNGGNEIFAVVGFNNIVSFNNPGGELPSLTGQNSFVDPSVGRAHFAAREGFDVSEDVFEAKLDEVWETGGDFLKAVRLGGLYGERKKRNTQVRTQNDVACIYCGYAIPVPQGLLRPYDAGSFLSGAGGNLPRQWLTFSADEYFRFLESTEAANAQDRAAGRPIGTSAALLAQNGGYTGIVYPTSYVVKEEVAAAYVQADLGGEIGAMPWTANIGVRYVHTDVTSNGSQQALIDLVPRPGDPTDFISTLAPDATPVRQETSYDDFLPTLNARLNVTDTVVARLGASRTVTRPNLTDLAPRVNYTNLRPGNLQASGGNTQLRPFKSDNLDASFEWYYQEAGFLTVGLFYKKVKNFIVNQVATEQFPVANSAGNFPGGLASFTVLRPRNLEEATVKGAEVGFQHNFTYLPAPLDGFGFTANATFVDSNIDTGDGASFALEGLGDSQNLIVFYEKGPIEARVAYNRRESFIQTLANGTGGDPINVRTYDQVDAQVRYRLTDRFSLFAEGVNLTNSKTRRFGQFGNHFIDYVETGPRYALGARAEF